MRLYTREEVGLALPKRGLTKASRRRSQLFLHHSVTPTTSDPFHDWRVVQLAGFGRKFQDISYTFGAHQRGFALEGRSPDVLGAHTEGHNGTAHAICCIGNFEGMIPTAELIETVRWLRQHMVLIGLLTPDHSFDPHRSVSKTACPGAMNVLRMELFRAPWGRLVGTPIYSPPSEQRAFEESILAKPTLRKGATGQDVRILQSLLIAHAPDLCMFFSSNDIDRWVDGTFGDNTQYVLTEWQRRTGKLTPDGVCGPKTWAWLCGV